MNFFMHGSCSWGMIDWEMDQWTSILVCNVNDVAPACCGEKCKAVSVVLKYGSWLPVTVAEFNLRDKNKSSIML